MTRPDPLALAADLLDVARDPQVWAARSVILRTAEHADACSACSGLDAALLHEAADVLAVVVDAEIDAAAVELAHELEFAGACRAAGSDGTDG